MNTHQVLREVLIEFADQADPQHRLPRSSRYEVALGRVRAALYAAKQELAYPPVVEVSLPGETSPESL